MPRNCECLILGSVQDQVGWGFRQLGLVKHIPALDDGRLEPDGIFFNPNRSVILPNFWF